MNADLIKNYVRKQKTYGAMQQALIAAVALLAGLVIVFLTFWFSYAIIWFGMLGVSAATQIILSTPLHLSHNGRLLCSGIFIVLLFVQHFRTNPAYWGEYAQENYTPYVPIGGEAGALASLLAHPGTSANMVADILLSGPRLVAGCRGYFAQARQLRRLDEEACSTLLNYLLTQPHSVPYEELTRAGWDGCLRQLRGFDGVQFLQKGVIMTPELRQELANQDYATV